MKLIKIATLLTKINKIKVNKKQQHKLYQQLNKIKIKFNNCCYKKLLIKKIIIISTKIKKFKLILIKIRNGMI